MFMLGERRQGIIRCVVGSSLHVLPDSYGVGPVQRGLSLMSRDSVSCSINHFMLDSFFFLRTAQQCSNGQDKGEGSVRG